MIGLFTGPLLALLVFLISLRGAVGRERSFLLGGFAAHIAGTVGIVAYHAYIAGGDMLGYAYYGRQLARLMELDFTYYAPEVCKLALHLENGLPPLPSYDTSFNEYLGTTTTTTMFALTGLVMLVVGTTLSATALVFSLFAYGGTVFFYRHLRPALLEHERLPVLAAFMFVPSMVFWSSGIVKEAVVMGFLGLFCGALLDTFRRRRLSSILIGAVGALGMGLVKPYVIFPLILAGGAWVNTQRERKHAWLTRIGALVAAAVTLAALAQLFPQFGVDRLGQTVAGQQDAGAYAQGGSYVEIGGGEDRTLLGQVRFLPIALINALARPFLFEAKNASMVLAGLETLVAAGLIVAVLQRNGLRGVYRRIVTRPPFAAAVVFTVSFGIAVGLTTSNLGTLSRYRIPMMPFYAAVLFAMRVRDVAGAATRHESPVPKLTGFRALARARNASRLRVDRSKKSA